VVLGRLGFGPGLDRFLAQVARLDNVTRSWTAIVIAE
jgi:hypothetical protein